MTLTLFLALGLAYLLVPDARRGVVASLRPIVLAYAVGAVLTAPLVYYALSGFVRGSFGDPPYFSTDLLNLVIPTHVFAPPSDGGEAPGNENAAQYWLALLAMVALYAVRARRSARELPRGCAASGRVPLARHRAPRQRPPRGCAPVARDHARAGARQRAPGPLRRLRLALSPGLPLDSRLDRARRGRVRRRGARRPPPAMSCCAERRDAAFVSAGWHPGLGCSGALGRSSPRASSTRIASRAARRSQISPVRVLGRPHALAGGAARFMGRRLSALTRRARRSAPTRTVYKLTYRVHQRPGAPDDDRAARGSRAAPPRRPDPSVEIHAYPGRDAEMHRFGVLQLNGGCWSRCVRPGAAGQPRLSL